MPTDAPLPFISLEPCSGITVGKIGCRWFGEGSSNSALILLCLFLGLWSMSAMQRGCTGFQAAFCMLKASDKFSDAYKGKGWDVLYAVVGVL